jgi:hypothetical protein
MKKALSTTVVACALLLGVTRCGSDENMSMISAVKELKTAVSGSIPASSSRSVSGSRASLSTPWTNGANGMGGDFGTTLKSTVQNYFVNDANSEGIYFGVKRRVLNALDVVCVLATVVPSDSLGVPTVGTGSITFDSTNKTTIISNCSVTEAFFGNIDGTTVTYTVTDVSGETNSKYDRKIVIDSTNVKNDIYFRASSAGINFLMYEPVSTGAASPTLYKSSTIINYVPASKALKLDYISSYNNTTYPNEVPAKEIMRFFSDGTEVHMFGSVASAFDGTSNTNRNYFTMLASYKASSPTNMAISITTDATAGGFTAVTDANACVATADYSIATDNSLACEVTGTAVSSALSFIKSTYHKLPFSFHAAITSSRGITFTNKTDMYTTAPE